MIDRWMKFIVFGFLAGAATAFVVRENTAKQK